METRPIMRFKCLDDHAQTSSTHSQEADLLARKWGFLWLRPETRDQRPRLTVPISGFITSSFLDCFLLSPFLVPLQPAHSQLVADLSHFFCTPFCLSSPSSPFSPPLHNRKHASSCYWYYVGEPTGPKLCIYVVTPPHCPLLSLPQGLQQPAKSHFPRYQCVIFNGKQTII